MYELHLKRSLYGAWTNKTGSSKQISSVESSTEERTDIMVINKSLRDVRPLRYSSWDGHDEGERVKRERGRHSKFMSYPAGTGYGDFWGLLTNVSRTRSTFSADGLGRPVRFAAHRYPLCWNFMYHWRIVFSVGGSVWYMVRNLHCTVTIDPVLANSKTQNAFLFPAHAIFRQTGP
jgi:hypothetical protein